MANFNTLLYHDMKQNKENYVHVNEAQFQDINVGASDCNGFVGCYMCKLYLLK